MTLTLNALKDLNPKNIKHVETAMKTITINTNNFILSIMPPFPLPQHLEV